MKVVLMFSCFREATMFVKNPLLVIPPFGQVRRRFVIGEFVWGIFFAFLSCEPG